MPPSTDTARLSDFIDRTEPDNDGHQVRLILNGAMLVADLSGALWWPDRRILVVADLHLEKGSALAAAGHPLPPYDTRATLARLTALLDRFAPEMVLCLGDSFHDDGAEYRLDPADRQVIKALTARADWLWLVGNHDPAPTGAWGGRVLPNLTLSPLVFRHHAVGTVGEVSGHWHPKAHVRVRNHRMSGRCFVENGERLILPAFGAFTGGLNVHDPAIAALFPRSFVVHLLGRTRIHRFDSGLLLPDPPRPVHLG